MKQKTKFKQTEIGKMPEDWEVKTIEEIKAEGKGAIISGPFGSNIGSRFFVPTGIPVIRGNNLKEDMTRFVESGFVYLTEEKAKELNTWAKREDIIFTAAGTIGQVGIIPNNSKYKEYIISNKQLRLRVDTKKAYPLFVFYWFSSPQMVSHIKQRNTGSTIPLINLSVLKSLPLPLPSIPEQQSIVKILSSLDAKIELNNKMNQILESIGQVLFKKWFVDESKKEWKEGKLGELIEFVKGKKPDEVFDKQIDNSLPQILIDVLDGNPPKYALIRDNSVIIKPSEVLMVMDGASSGRVEIGFEGILGSTLAKIKAIDERISNYYLYYFLKERQEDIKGNTTGTSIPHADKGKIERFVFNIPDKKILAKFDEIAEQIQKKVFINKYEIVKLSQIRDAFLPKLMSGEIRVK